MIEVLAIVCAMSVPLEVHPTELMTNKDTRADCKEIRKVFYEDASKLTPHQCMQNGAKFAIEWLAKHPDWRLRLIKCAPKKGLYALEQKA